MNIRDHQDQHAKQHHDFYSIVNKKLNTGTVFLPVVSNPQVFKIVSISRFIQFIPRTSFWKKSHIVLSAYRKAPSYRYIEIYLFDI